jgi:DNA-binding FadR family transcriptional regulator
MGGCIGNPAVSHLSLITPARFDESLEEHRNLIHCILTGNTAEAQRVNRYHLRMAKEKILEHLAQRNADSAGTSTPGQPE